MTLCVNSHIIVQGECRCIAGVYKPGLTKPELSSSILESLNCKVFLDSSSAAALQGRRQVLLQERPIKHTHTPTVCVFLLEQHQPRDHLRVPSVINDNADCQPGPNTATTDIFHIPYSSTRKVLPRSKYVLWLRLLVKK